MPEDLTIRNACPDDAAELVRIYAPYVRETAVSFEYEVPTVEAFAERVATTLERYPYLVAERDGGIVGYAYAGPFKARAAYDWSAELSVYVDRTVHDQGVGRALYEELEDRLRTLGLVNLYACITTSDKEDEYINFDSIYFHKRMGFTLAGRFRHCGCKFGRWYDMIWMEKKIADHVPDPAPPRW